MYKNLSTPSVIVHLESMEKNIRKMISDAKEYGLTHRPHIKTHRSSEIAKLQLEAGANGITCARLGEAELMADNGIKDIFLAYPVVGEDKCQRYIDLSKRCSIRSIVNNVDAAMRLSDAALQEGLCLEVLIDIDSGVMRGGLEPGLRTLEFAETVRNFKGIKIVGLMYYPGTAYAETTVEGISRVARKEHDDLIETARLLSEHGFAMEVLSAGNTPTSKVPSCLEGLTEIRAGNYVFNDCAQLNIGRVAESDCALRVISTVIASVDEYNAIIDAGTKALSSDMLPNNGNVYGTIVGHEDVKLVKLNEEHGFITSDNPLQLEVGERIEIIPNHACVVANLVDKIYGCVIMQLSEKL